MAAAAALIMVNADSVIDSGAAARRAPSKPEPPERPVTPPRRWAPLWLLKTRLYRRSLRTLGFYRFLRGGRIKDLGRLPRYALTAAIALGAIWLPITAYLLTAPKQYKSEVTLILPGSGVATSVNLSEIGQASTAATSAYASSSLSPSVTYKNLLESDRVIDGAANIIGVAPHSFGKPTIKLVDETSLIHFSMTDRTPASARRKGDALVASFMTTLDKLRTEEIGQREAAAATAIRSYHDQVDAIRAQINALQLQSGLTSAEQYASIVSAAETLQIQVADTDAQLKEKDAGVKSLASLLNISPQIAALTLKVQADEEIGSLAEAAAKAAGNAAELEQQYGPNHPKYLDARAKEMGLRTRMVARGVAISGLDPAKLNGDVNVSSKGERPMLLARLVSTVVDRQGLAAQLSARRAELEARRNRIHILVEIGSKLDALNRDYKIADAVFASALARVNTAKADTFASYPMAQVFEPASLPKSPSSPSVLIAAGAGVAASFLLFVGLAMTWIRQPLINRIVAQTKQGGHDEEA